MSDDEDYAIFGKQLKELAEGDTIRKRPLTVEEQIVTDQKGKRRFHGAFTGGFSAGFFNTVDTPEGWAPSQFKSSKNSSRIEQRVQRPEDFMDDEDLGDFGFAAQGLRTKKGFQSKQEQPKEKPSSSTSSGFLVPAVEQLIRPTAPTVGERLLIQQGWKPGQGIGPKLSKSVRKDRSRSYRDTYLGRGNKSIDDGSGSDEESLLKDKYKDFLFAPDELPITMAKPKDDFFGIGYQGLDRRFSLFNPDLDFNLKSGVEKKKFSISGQAFGVGAFEEEDEDVYSRNDMGQYDYSLEVTREKKEKKKMSSGTNLAQILEGLEGFTIGTTKSTIVKHFPGPSIPRDWVARSDPSSIRSRFGPPVLPQSESSSNKSSNRSAGTNPTREERRAALCPEDRKHDSSRSRRSSNDKDMSMGSAEKADEQPAVLPAFLSESEAKKSAVGHSSFKPFSNNEKKQTRYEQYLVCLENNRKDALRLLQPKNMTEWERERERVEFERAAMLYRPLKASMTSRFVSAGHALDNSSDAGLTNNELDVNSDKRKAAEMKMFGQLTRDTAEWVPARLLCLRFNIQNPFSDGRSPGTNSSGRGSSNTKRDLSSAQLFSVLDNAFKPPKAEAMDAEEREDDVAETTDDMAKTKGNDVKDEDVILVKNEDPDIQQEERPPMDLFKAIFADSDSDSDDDDDKNGRKSPTASSSMVPSRQDSQISTNVGVGSNSNSMKSNRKDDSEDDEIGPKPPPVESPKTDNPGRRGPIEPARGIFANIDFDALNRRRRRNSPETIIKEKIAPTKAKSVLDQSVRTVLGIKNPHDSSDDEYGPALPPPPSSMQQIVISSDSSEDEKKHKKSKKKSKDKKSKKHKKEKKKKHKSK